MSPPCVIYLDQNKWLDLAKASDGDELSILKRKLAELVSQGLVVLPLSAAHYMETWHRGDTESRLNLAGIMRDLSGYVTVAPIQAVRELEIESILLSDFREHVGFCQCEPVDVAQFVLGHGVDHAFDSPTGRLRVVSSIADEATPEGAPLPPDKAFVEALKEAKALPGDAYEWWSLSGGYGGYPQEGFELYTQHRRGSEFAAMENEASDYLADRGYKGDRLESAILAREINDLMYDLRAVAHRHDFDLEALAGTLQSKWNDDFAESLLKRVSSRALSFQFSVQKHRNKQKKWVQHDLADVAALCVAGVYADIVVTERQWVHFMNRGGITREWGTVAVSKMSDLLVMLDAS